MPWPGIFEQIRQSDIFVHFDDVSIPQGRSFVTRVQIKTSDGEKWLSVPVKRQTRGLIKDVLIDNEKNWKQSHFDLVKCSLGKTHYFRDVVALMNEIFSYNISHISELNMLTIEKISQYLGLKTKFLKSSEFNIQKKSSDKLIALVKKLSGTVYITGHGARNYLDHELFEANGISVEYMDYNILPYEQSFGSFTAFVSIIDLIAYHGKDAIDFMKSKTVNWRQFIND